MEEDTGKSLHVGGATGRIHGAEHSLVDYNRAGIPLIEIVTKPVPGVGRYAPELARAYVAELRDILRSLGVSDVRMEQGSLRCDVNVSIAPVGAAEWGKRTETKNVNSLRSVERAVRYEIERQAAILDARRRRSSRRPGTGRRTPARPRRVGARRRRRTTATSPSQTSCRSRRPRERVEELRGTLPELPRAMRVRLLEEWQLSAARHAGVDQRRRGRSCGRRRWRRARRRRTRGSGGSASSPARRTSAASSCRRCRSRRPRWPAWSGWSPTGALNDKLARQVLEAVLAGEGEPDEIVAARGLAVVSDEGALGDRRRRRDRGEPRRGGQDPRRQGRRGRRAGRCGHEGHPRPGRRRPRPRTRPGAAGAAQ